MQPEPARPVCPSFGHFFLGERKLSLKIEDQQIVDLFGNVRFAVARTRGRPPFEWTEENSRKVSMLLAMGWTNERIATCVLDPRTGKPISLATLKRHFRAELKIRDVARDHLTAKRLMEVNAAAEKGNVGAMRLREKMIEKNDLALAAARIADAQAGEKAPPGKKARSQADAERKAGGDGSARWGSDLKPGYRH